LGSVRITCRVPARPFPSKPGEFRPILAAATSAYEISPGGGKKLVPSEVHIVGGGGDGFGPDPQPEWVEFDVLIPLDSEELDAEARRYLTKLGQSMAPEQKEQLKEHFTEDGKKKMLERLRPFVYQQRVGHFQVECRVLDGSRVMGTDVVEIEVVFKGRFADFGLPGVAPA